MTISKSSPSRSSWRRVALLLVFLTGIAHAGHRRVVVLDFDGPKAEKFHDEVVEALKRHDHTIISNDRWNGAAEELGVTKFNKKGTRKVAHRLKVDGVVQGTVEKTDDGYVVHVKLREGKTGKIIAESIDLKANGTKLPKHELDEQLVSPIEALEENHGGDVEPAGGNDDEDDKPPGFSKHNGMNSTGSSATDDSPKHHDKPSDPSDPPKHHHKHRDTADVSPDGTPTDTPEPAKPMVITGVSHGERAIDFGLGLSFTARSLKFNYTSTLASQPPSYHDGVPVAGGIIDVTIYPGAIMHHLTGILTDFGIEVLYDKVFAITTKKDYNAGTGGNIEQMTASLGTSEGRFAVGAVFRYPVTKTIVPGIKLLYVNQQFNVVQSLPDGSPTDLPDVHYGAIEPKLFLHYTVLPALTISAEGGIMLVTSTGQITNEGSLGDANSAPGYGRAKDFGYEFGAYVDYNFTKALFARAGFRVEGINLTFAGDPMSLSNNRDGDTSTQDVQSARDLYYGFALQLGYAY